MDGEMGASEQQPHFTPRIGLFRISSKVSLSCSAQILQICLSDRLCNRLERV